MAITYLVDTNIVSELMRPHPNATVRMLWESHASEITISTISWHELLVGAMYLPVSKRRTALENFLYQNLLNRVEMLPYNQMAAEWHAIERARLMKIGRTPSFSDGQIAAVAATNNMILVTRNVADFADFDGLTVENWFEES